MSHAPDQAALPASTLPRPAVPDFQLRFRQIHLDFHTSPDVPDVARDFDPDAFAERLDRARVNSCTVFGRCHHGYVYYPSEAHPERRHPTSVRPNLVGEQIEALHRRGIRAPIYTTIQWDKFTSDAHPEWLIIDSDGMLRRYRPLEAGFYGCLDVFHPGYRGFLRDHVRDLFDSLPVDGLFFDICQPYYSVARFWLDAMDNRGYDPENEDQRIEFGNVVMHEWQQEMAEFSRQLASDSGNADPDTLSIFFNSGHCGPRHQPLVDRYTHFELESLPADWGYMHFPVSQRFMRTLPRDTMTMTGKFHTGWGDFQSYKNQPALRFECLHALTLNAKCSVGDQLHPYGVLEDATYDLIGSVFSEVETKEPWCERATHHAEIGVLTSEEINPLESTFEAQCDRPTVSALGMVRLLQELRHQFDVLTSQSDLAPYRLLIIPDDYPVDDELAANIQAFVDAGGALIAMHGGGVHPDGDRMTLEALGVDLVGPGEWDPDHVRPAKLGSGVHDLPDTPHVMYDRPMAVKPRPGTEVLAEAVRPFFNRTRRHFCSHRQTPPAMQDAGYPAATRNGRCIYFAHPLFTTYKQKCPAWIKYMLDNAIELLMPGRMLRMPGAPSSTIAALNHQPDPADGGGPRDLLHVLSFIPERRGDFDILEDVIPLHDVACEVRRPEPPTKARLVPQGEPLDVTVTDGVAHFTIPRVEGHQIVELTR